MAIAEIFSNGFLIVQSGVLLLMLLALVGCLMFAKSAHRAASFMRDAQKETQALYGSMDRQMQNMQMMSDEVRRLADDVSVRQEELSARFPASEQKPGAAGDAGATRDDAPARTDFAEEDAEEEKKPSTLFRSLLRRR